MVPKRIFLCGFMGCGKTTLGKKLATGLNYTFIDLDNLIEETEKTTILTIFESQGEQAFRALETKSLHTLITSNEHMVVSLGGGTPCFNDNLRLLKENGCLVYIQTSAITLQQRLLAAKKTRPLLKDKTKEELLEYIKETLEKRELYYSEAHVILNGISLTANDVKQALSVYSRQNE